MDKAKFVYIVYINSTPEKVWNALGDSELIKLYWGRHRNVSDWKPGAKWSHQDYDDANKVDIEGEVVESIPPNKLVLTWCDPSDRGKADETSRVTFEIEPFMDTVKLTVTHDELKPGSKMDQGIRQGWPAVLSSLKTLLETGQPLAMTTKRWSGQK